MKPTFLLVVDDHAIIRKGIEMMVRAEPSIEIVGEAGDGAEAIRLAKELCPDVILMDLMMPVINGIEATVEIKRCTPDVKIIVLTAFEDEAWINKAMQAGADGYLLKDKNDANALLCAIQQVQHGYLAVHPRVTRHLSKPVVISQDTNGVTGREKEVLQLMAKGLSNQGIAQILNLTKGTVKIHVSRILEKLHASNRTEAVIFALKHGIINWV